MVGHTFEISHEGGSARVQGINDHLAVDGTRDLDATVLETGGRLGSSPGGILTDVAGLRQKVGQTAVVELDLALLAALKESLASGLVGAVQGSDELEDLGGEDLSLGGGDLGKNGQAGDFGIERHGYR